MNEDLTTDLITLIDDQGAEHEFEVLDIIDHDKGCFYALMPVPQSKEELAETDGIYYIFEEIEEAGEKQLAEVEDDELLDELAEELERRFENFYEDE